MAIDAADSSGSDTDRASDGENGDGETPTDGRTDSRMQPVDGGADAADGTTDGRQTCSADQARCDGTCVDRRRNREHCGRCGAQCSGREVCTDGDCVCPRYHEKCDGSCVATHIDPDNCGGCGQVCGPSEVCSAGSCADSCLPGRTSCGRRCVDRDTNSNHCGSCGNQCADGEACLDGSCQSAIEVSGAPNKCVGGGPPIRVEANASGREKCLGNVARGAFRWAVCACDRLTVDDLVETDAYDSTLGRYRPGGLGGSIGTNGNITVNNDLEVYGAVW
ncbi:MAG: MXAN_6577-like cysteine-rich protein, partial [Bradymonadaceae bacterium]